MPETLTLHPDRALPAEPALRAISRRILGESAALPIVSMHGHVDAEVLASNGHFLDAAHLLVVPDHYVTRMLVSQGVSPEALGAPRSDQPLTELKGRAIWRLFCENWSLFRGTPSRLWLEHELVEVLGVTTAPSATTADALYDQITARLAQPDFAPLALLDRFNVEVISTTDAASSPLNHHDALAAAGQGERILPTFRPDAAVDIGATAWQGEIEALGEASGVEIGDFASYLRALRERRRAFVARGARASDHGHLHADTTPMDNASAARLFAEALSGAEISTQQVRAFSAHMLFEFAGMSVEDGLVMQLHAGVHRNHHGATYAALGADRGFDIPIAGEFTRALLPLLNAYGLDPRFRCIVYTVDESVYSRELAPLAGVYPSLLLGAPWWFIDSPEGMRRFREAATETAGFYNTAGFVDDTRALASIPARHDVARRIDAGWLARLVAEHRLGEDEAVETARDLAYHLPLRAFKRTVEEYRA